ncbi:glycosyl hydrolase [Spongisporangium articulatum]|uniref:Glycosyl hydrolase n=1 Tax=Spongisporangium articulatum TaxID=3362603 RepID=A0ABW8AJB7_9ACTN
MIDWDHDVPTTALTLRRRRPRWPWVVAAVLVVLVAIGGVGLYLLTRDPNVDNDKALQGVDQPRAAVSDVKLGVFRGTDPAQVAAFGNWLGRPVDYALDFSPRNTWEDIANPAHMLDVWKGTPYRMVFSVAMLPDGDRSQDIASGARGDYDWVFQELATKLVEAGQEDAVLRIGWEFNLAESRWASDDSASWIKYWRQIVKTMKAVPGQNFEFDWNPNNGKNPHDAVDFYPGDDVVDYIGVDAYDVSYAMNTYPYPSDCDDACKLERQKRAWAKSVYGGSRGLYFWSKFARHHGKPLSLPEWGIWERLDGHGGQEDLYYLAQMKKFIDDPANGVAYQLYFEYDAPDGKHELQTTYPKAGEWFRKNFGGQ